MSRKLRKKLLLVIGTLFIITGIVSAAYNSIALAPRAQLANERHLTTRYHSIELATAKHSLELEQTLMIALTGLSFSNNLPKDAKKMIEIAVSTSFYVRNKHVANFLISNKERKYYLDEIQKISDLDIDHENAIKLYQKLEIKLRDDSTRDQIKLTELTGQHQKYANKLDKQSKLTELVSITLQVLGLLFILLWDVRNN